jgi:hypothetical protein
MPIKIRAVSPSFCESGFCDDTFVDVVMEILSFIIVKSRVLVLLNLVISFNLNLG